jgi:hypothetical protein
MEIPSITKRRPEVYTTTMSTTNTAKMDDMRVEPRLGFNFP